MTFVIVGAGAFGREVLDVVLALGDPPADDVVFADDDLAGTTIRERFTRRLDDLEAGSEMIVAIADPTARRRIVGYLTAQGLQPRTLIDPRAVVGPETYLGTGCALLATAFVSSCCSIGDHVQVNYQASIGHDALIDDYATVLPGANIGGLVRLETGATVGSNAIVLPHRRVGVGATVGAGAVVTHDVDDGQVVTGVPARPAKRR